MEPSGLYFFDKVYDVNRSNTIVKDLDKLKWIPFNKTTGKGRLVQHYGYYFNYDDYTVDELAPEMPNVIKDLKAELINKCTELKLPADDFDQCIVNNYYPGQGITPHIDHSAFGPVIGCFTFCSGGNMRFSMTGHNPHQIYTTSGSLYIMSDDARYKWKHEMPCSKSDIVNGEEIQRGRRISVTFRKVVK
jgi:alkylated DNA repair dioxygenase AlkB